MIRYSSAEVLFVTGKCFTDGNRNLIEKLMSVYTILYLDCFLCGLVDKLTAKL